MWKTVEKENVFVRKVQDEWFILESPDGKFPSGGYFKKSTGCNSKRELKEHLETTRERPVKLITI